MRNSSIASRGSRRKLLALLAVIAMAAVLAACGDSDDDGSTADGDQAGSGASVEEAQEIVDRYSDRPTEIPVETPIEEPVPEDKTVVYLDCGLPTCAFQFEIIKNAADILGWNADTVTQDGTPEGLRDAWEQVLRMDPDGVIYSGAERQSFDRQLKEAEEAGIIVAPYSVGDPPGDGISFVTATFDEQDTVGTMLAAWPIAEEEGPTDILVVNFPFAVLTSFKEDINAELERLCPGCNVSNLEIALNQLGTGKETERIVSELRANPDITWVLLTDNSLDNGLPQAIRSAGIDDVQVMGSAATPTTLTELAAGELPAIVSFAYYEILYTSMDAIARGVTPGVPLLDSIENPLPYWYLTAENQVAEDEAYPLVEDYQEQFREIWGK